MLKIDKLFSYSVSTVSTLIFIGLLRFKEIVNLKKF